MKNPHRRGFALPMVIAIMVIATTILGAILVRHSGSQSTVKRHLDAYLDHHTARGMQEAVAAWLNGNANAPMRELLDFDGKAFDLIGEDGGVVSVYFEEAQDTALAQFAGLSPQELQLAAGVIDALREDLGPQAARFTRKEGPMTISVLSAPREVLEAAARSVVGGARADDVAIELMRIREDPEPTDGKLNEAFANLSVTPEDRAKLLQIVTAEPALWRVTIVSSTGAGEPVRYRALTMVPGGRRRSGAAGAAAGGVRRSSSFLSWEKVFDEPDQAR